MLINKITETLREDYILK